jgi:MFS superfamily sulfate permease-like transporter
MCKWGSPIKRPLSRGKTYDDPDVCRQSSADLCPGPETGNRRLPSDLRRIPGDETFPGLLIARTEGGMTFASAPRIGERFRELIREAKPRVLLLECSAIPNFEYTAWKLLIEAEEKLREGGVALWLAALNPRALEVVKRSPLFDAMGYERMFFNVGEAVEPYLKAGK